MPRRAFRLAFRLATAQSSIAASSFASPSYSDDEEDAVSGLSSSTTGRRDRRHPRVVQPRQEAGLAVVREAAALAFRFLVTTRPLVLRAVYISTEGRVLGLQDVDELPHAI